MKFVPMNFGYVEEKIFRCAAPEPRNFPFLETLQLRTCLVLQPEGPSDAFAAWLRENTVQVLSPLSGPLVGLAGIAGLAGAQAPSLGHGAAPSVGHAIVESVVIDVLGVLLNPACYPVLVCCAMGRHWTGTVVGCLRKVQRWNLTSILEEYRRFANHKGRLSNEEFIELFDVDMVHVPAGVRPTVLWHTLPGSPV